jgi:hypothetical protein
MAVTKSISARVLVAFWFEECHYKPNQVIEQPASVVAMLKELGSVDDDPAAVAYCLKTAGS